MSCVSLVVSLAVSLTISCNLSCSHSPSLSHSLFHSPSVSFSLSQSLSLFLPLSQYLSPSVMLHLRLPISYSHPLKVSYHSTKEDLYNSSCMLYLIICTLIANILESALCIIGTIPWKSQELLPKLNVKAPHSPHFSSCRGLLGGPLAHNFGLQPNKHMVSKFPSF